MCTLALLGIVLLTIQWKSASMLIYFGPKFVVSFSDSRSIYWYHERRFICLLISRIFFFSSPGFGFVCHSHLRIAVLMNLHNFRSLGNPNGRIKVKQHRFAAYCCHYVVVVVVFFFGEI